MGPAKQQPHLCLSRLPHSRVPLLLLRHLLNLDHRLHRLLKEAFRPSESFNLVHTRQTLRARLRLEHASTQPHRHVERQLLKRSRRGTSTLPQGRASFRDSAQGLPGVLKGVSFRNYVVQQPEGSLLRPAKPHISLFGSLSRGGGDIMDPAGEEFELALPLRDELAGRVVEKRLVDDAAVPPHPGDGRAAGRASRNVKHG
mmetsp:Transcript_8779/g.21699  ORF Transcript_8779/g.21699 Transcript_8779/m.21699 type:complete len:200 (+) Transcript_8779:1217-1816(+)